MHKRAILALPLLIAATSPALAHVGHGSLSGFSAGIAHPLLGLDHLLAMVAVGLWAALQGGRTVWLWPASFVTAMVVGALLAMSGVPVPSVEPGILASVIVLGALIGLATRFPLAGGAALIALFGLFHGHAHGTELPLAASAASYLTGFAIATAGLHAAGVALGLAGRSHAAQTLASRALGWGVCAAGVALLAA